MTEGHTLTFGECGRCSRTVVRQHSWPAPTTRAEGWYHVGADGYFWRGCRAASFSKEDGWDDSIPRAWTAKPTLKSGLS